MDSLSKELAESFVTALRERPEDFKLKTGGSLDVTGWSDRVLD
jgi:hypothetical protein